MSARLVLAACAVAIAGSAGAQSIFTCRDNNGRAISSDRPIPECADRAMRETTPGGVLKREIAAPLTPEQLAQKEADERLRRQVEESLREKRRRDSALLAAYSNEDQIERARRRSLADVQESLRMSKARLDELNKQKQALANDTRQYAGKPPPLVQRRVEDNQAAIDDEIAAMKLREADLGRINQRYDDDLRRFRELMAANRPTR